MIKEVSNNEHRNQRLLTDSLKGYSNLHEFEDIIIKFGFLTWVFKKYLDFRITNLPSYRLNSNGVVQVSNFINDVNDVIKKQNINNVNKKVIDLIKEVCSSLAGYENNLLNISSICELFSNENENEIKTLFAFDYDYYKYSGRTPYDVYELASKILNEADGHKLLDVYSRRGIFFYNMAVKDLSSNKVNKSISEVSLFEQNGDDALISRIRATVLGIEYEIIEDSEFIEPSEGFGSEIKFNKIFCEPPFGERLTRIFVPEFDYDMMLSEDDGLLRRNATTEWRYILRSTKVLSNKGKLVAIIPTGLLSRITDIPVRRALIERGLIEAVISLPQWSYPGTGISVSLVVFSRGNDRIKMIDGELLKPKLNRGQSQVDVDRLFEYYLDDKKEKFPLVPGSELLYQDSGCNISPKKYNTVLTAIENPTPLTALAEDIFRGYQLTAHERSSLSANSIHGSVRVLTLTDIEDSNISDNLHQMADNKKFHRYYVRDGDVVISARGTKIKAAVVELQKNIKGESEPILATGNLIVIRPIKSMVDPYYLCAYIQGRTGVERMLLIQTGTVLASINPSELKRFEIPLIELDRQKRIGRKFRENIASLKMLKNQIASIHLDLEDIAVEGS